jgi:hypothetical protein
MDRAIVVAGVLLQLVPAVGPEGEWVVHETGRPIGVLRHADGKYEVILPVTASKGARELMERVRDAVEREWVVGKSTES